MHTPMPMYLSFCGGRNRSADDFSAMYNQIRVPPTRELACTSSPGDVTSPIQASPPPSPTTSELQFEDILDDPEYDLISDRKEIVEGEACWRRDPSAIRRRAMAEDFSEGKLETVVDNPQKENAGTQTQYVSYQVTTKVGLLGCMSVPCPRSSHVLPSPTSNRSRSPNSPSAAASQTLSSCGSSCQKSTHNARFRRYQTNTRWSTCEETALGPTSPNGGHTHCIASSSAWHCTPCCGGPCSSSHSSRRPTGTST
jgi:hypothetical protein